MKTRYLLILLVIIASFRTYSQESKLLTKTSDLTFCLDSSEFKIGLLNLELGKSDVFEIIGQPDSIRIDSGLFTYTAMHYYEGLSVYYWGDGVLDTVLGIFVSSDKYITPSGIHTGLSRDKAFEILGLEQNEILSLEHKIEFSGCHNDDYVIEFVFDNSFILREIIMGIDIL